MDDDSADEEDDHDNDNGKKNCNQFFLYAKLVKGIFFTYIYM